MTEIWNACKKVSKLAVLTSDHSNAVFSNTLATGSHQALEMWLVWIEMDCE